MKNKKILLSCGATIAAVAITFTPVGGALAADEVTPEPDAIVVVDETTAGAEAPVADESDDSDLDIAVDESPEPVAVPVEEVAPVPEDETAATTDTVPVINEAAAPELAPEAPTAPSIAAPLISTDGLTPIGTGVWQPSPAAPAVAYDRYMPTLHAAHISGVAVPEGNAAPDEVELDLRSLVGVSVQSPTDSWQESGFRYAADGALAARPDTGESVNVPGFSERVDWSEFAFDITALPRTGIASDTTATDGKLRLVAFDQNATYGVAVTLRHIPTGITSGPITITGRSGTDGASAVAWVANAPEAAYDGGTPMWAASERAEWRNGHFLTWSNPHETIAPAGERVIMPATPRLVRGEAPAGTSTGFGLTDYGFGPQTDNPSYRIGVLTGEPTKTVSIDLAERIPGVTVVALPSAEDGTLDLPATGGLWSKDREFVGLDYNAPDGLNVSVSGTVLTFDFGSAEWLNAAGITVPVLMADGTVEWAEVRTESLPRDIAGGLVERRIPVATTLFISDAEMLAASRLTGLSPSMAEVQAVELPDGVARVADGFAYAGSAEPTELTFGFTVAETVQTEFGPVVPDATAPGEVRIAVVAGETPTAPDPEPTVEQETPAVVTPPTASAPPMASGNPSFPLGDAGPLVTANTATASASSPLQSIVLGLAGGLSILGLVVLSAVLLRRRAEG